MPTYESLAAFLRDWSRLTPEQRRLFLKAVVTLVTDLRAGGPFRAALRVKKMQGHERIWEMTWAPDGRATFMFGDEVKDGHPHIIWRRIGTHEIFRAP